MTEKNQETIRMQIANILNLYRFEMRGYKAGELLDRWAELYSPGWIEMAVLEALYQGRYKIKSVEEILKIWRRRGYPSFHFTGDFERLVRKNLPSGEIETRTIEAEIEPESQKAEPEEIGETSVLQEPHFDDPRHKMSDLGELFDKIGFKAPEVPKIELQEEKTNPIEHFTPLLDGSQLYSKLVSVARAARGEV